MKRIRQIKRILFYFVIVFFAFVIGGCKEAYEPAVQSLANNYLVVEGVLNSKGLTIIKLSRAVKVSSKEIKGELHAKVTIESSNKTTYTLTEKGNGEYSAIIPVNNNEKYRLYIKTTDGKEYASAFVSPLQTPPIDEINWKREKDGVQIYTNTHDPNNNTWYYRWEYEETWEFVPEYLSNLDYIESTSRFVDAPFTRFPSVCWRSEKSNVIILASSKRLSSDVIYLNPTSFIPPKSEKLSIRYSILAKQYALTREGFEYWQNIKKNTEQLGSIFDAQPSELDGNIRCLSNSEELVIGYFTACSIEEKRIFISNSEVPGWGYRSDCRDVSVKNNPDSLSSYFPGYIPLYAINGGNGGVDRYVGAPPKCVDCRLKGTSVKPNFWR